MAYKAATILRSWLTQQNLRPSALARQLGMTRANISHVLMGRQHFSLTSALAIERLTGGSIRAEDLVPDLQEFLALVAQRSIRPPAAAKPPPATPSPRRTPKSPRPSAPL